MNIDLKITSIDYPVKTNSSYGNYAIGVNFTYIDNGYTSGTFRYCWTKKEAVKLYESYQKKIGTITDIFNL